MSERKSDRREREWQDDIPDDEYYSDEDRAEYIPGEETEEFERRIWKETENSIND